MSATKRHVTAMIQRIDREAERILARDFGPQHPVQYSDRFDSWYEAANADGASWFLAPCEAEDHAHAFASVRPAG